MTAYEVMTWELYVLHLQSTIVARVFLIWHTYSFIYSVDIALLKYCNHWTVTVVNLISSSHLYLKQYAHTHQESIKKNFAPSSFLRFEVFAFFVMIGHVWRPLQVICDVDSQEHKLVPPRLHWCRQWVFLFGLVLCFKWSAVFGLTTYQGLGLYYIM